jgi:hypothetical protein
MAKLLSLCKKKTFATVFEITTFGFGLLALCETTICVAERGAKAIMHEGDMHNG